MKYKIQRSIGGDGIKWVDSDSFPGYYTEDVAQAILDEYPQMNYCITPVTIKPYRRHASVTQLELRGAADILARAAKYVVEPVFNPDTFKAYSLLIDARLAVRRQLETL
jgi:hypothetical protein